MYYNPTPISWNNYHFLIMSAPDNTSMKRCVKDLEKFNVKHLARCCERTYDENQLTEANIKVTETNFPDGMLPPQNTVDEWLDIVDEFFETSATPPTGK